VLSPYGLDLVESCLTCKMRTDRIFCDLPPSALQAFERIKCSVSYPDHTVLFKQGQPPRGVYVLCKGHVKLSVAAGNGKTVIVNIAEPGEVLGLAATISDSPYELTAETIDPCQVNIVKRDDFLLFIKDYADACRKVAEHLSDKYNKACHDVRSLGLSPLAAERFAQLLLDWSLRNGESQKAEPRLKLSLTHEEIAQMLGVSRETVTRILADFRKRQIVQSCGSTLLIRDKDALEVMAGQKR
jgi:CRP/FNR family transcriptional regulator, cyclic AMP receptor protein